MLGFRRCARFGASGLAASPYARLRLRALDQRFTPKIAINPPPAELQKAYTFIRPTATKWEAEVTGWDPVQQYALCGRRRTALYSRSGMDITQKSACAACTIRGYRRVESKGQCFPLQPKPFVSGERLVFYSHGGTDSSERILGLGLHCTPQNNKQNKTKQTSPYHPLNWSALLMVPAFIGR